MAAERDVLDDEVKSDAVHLSLAGLSGAPKGDVVRHAPRYEGWLLKKGYRFHNVCACCIGPVWKNRYFVINGGFLFRFVHENHTKPKGRPIKLEDVTIRRAPMDEGDDSCLQVISLSKNHILRAPTTAIRDEWITQLRRAKQHAIKVSMGHAPMTRGELEARKLGDDIVKTKTKQRREGRRMQDQLMKEVQYSSATPW